MAFQDDIVCTSFEAAVELYPQIQYLQSKLRDIFSEIQTIYDTITESLKPNKIQWSFLSNAVHHFTGSSPMLFLFDSTSSEIPKVDLAKLSRYTNVETNLDALPSLNDEEKKYKLFGAICTLRIIDSSKGMETLLNLKTCVGVENMLFLVDSKNESEHVVVNNLKILRDLLKQNVNVVYQSENDVSTAINKHMEHKFMNVFHLLNVYLSEASGKETYSCRQTSTNEGLSKAISDFFSNPLTMLDFFITKQPASAEIGINIGIVSCIKSVLLGDIMSTYGICASSYLEEQKYDETCMKLLAESNVVGKALCRCELITDIQTIAEKHREDNSAKELLSESKAIAILNNIYQVQRGEAPKLTFLQDFEECLRTTATEAANILLGYFLKVTGTINAIMIKLDSVALLRMELLRITENMVKLKYDDELQNLREISGRLEKMKLRSKQTKKVEHETESPSDGHLYKLSWNGYPRVNAFRQHLEDLHDRCEEAMDTYSSLMQEPNLYHLNQVNSLMDDPNILVFGELNDRITVKTLVKNAEELGKNYSRKTVCISNWGDHTETSCPVICVLTGRLLNEEDFMCKEKLRENFSSIFLHLNDRFHKILTILYVIEIDENLASLWEDQREWTLPCTTETSVIVIKSYPAESTLFIPNEQLSNTISDFLEKCVASYLKELAEISKRNLCHIIQSSVPYNKSKVIDNIKQDLVSLMRNDGLIARTIAGECNDKEETLSTNRMEDFLLKAAQTRLEELSDSFGIERPLIQKILMITEFEQKWKMCVQDSNAQKLINVLKVNEVFQKPYDVKENEETISLFMKQVSSIIESTLQTIESVEESISIQEQIHFETISVLKRTIVKKDFPSFIPDIKVPVDKLSLLDGVKGFGIIYNKLHVHIEQRDEMGDYNIRSEIQKMLLDYPHPYEIEVIIQQPKPLFCVGHKVSSTRGNRRIFGTVGAFMKDQQGDMYILTAKHVVENAIPSDVYLATDGDEDTIVGTALYVPTIQNVGDPEEQSITPVDIAAVKIEDQSRKCDVKFRRPDGATGPFRIFRGPFEDVNLRKIYKRGASTGLTTGRITSENYTFRNMISDWHVLIQSEKSKPFAEEGDSGATVCTIDEDNNKTIIVIAMVTGGKFTARGKTGRETDMTLASYVDQGISALNLGLRPYE